MSRQTTRYCDRCLVPTHTTLHDGDEGWVTIHVELDPEPFDEPEGIDLCPGCWRDVARTLRHKDET